MSIVVTGSIAFDYLMSFPGHFTDHILPDQLDHISLSFLVDDLQRRRGGAAANIAYNLALLHERPMLMGTVGQDFAEYREGLEERGVDTSLVRDELDLFTASFFVNTDLEGNQIASFYTGAMARARQLSCHGLDAGDVDLVTISPNDPEAMVKYAAECQELGLPYLYDPSQQIVRLTADDLVAGLTGCSLLIVNEYEFGMMQRKTGMGRDEIWSAPDRACIVTLGAEGATIWADGNRYVVPPVSPRRIDDPTGVGDAFRAGLIKGLAMELPWDLAGRVGSLAATFTLEQPGAQEHHYSTQEFVDRFREHFDDGQLLDVMLD
jgi:adenosine kinase